MFHQQGDQVLKEDLMIKRATGRSRIKTYGYKQRVFVLRYNTLSYYEGTLEKRGRIKNIIDLSSIKAIELVDEGALDGKKNAFQIHFDDFVLYIIAYTEKQRSEWVTTLREELESKNKYFLQHFHSGIFTGGCWSCCNKIKTGLGCKETYFFKDERLSLKMVEDNGAIAARNSYIDSPKEQKVFKVTAKYNYRPTQRDDLALQKDEDYTVLNCEESSWWFARDKLGKEGYIPSNYVTRKVGIESEKWYHGDMTRQQADSILKKKGHDGMFLVRNSSQPGRYTLSLCYQGYVKHYHIKLNSENKYYVSQRHAFGNISELIEYHKLNCAGLVHRLKFPHTGADQAPVILGYGVFEIDREELVIRKKLGSGQFGTVYEATWRGSQQVAVKSMEANAIDAQQDFIEEAQRMQRFQHKNLVMMYGICSKKNPLYIVVELMVNGSLLEYLRSNKYMVRQTNILTDMAFQVSSAMKYLEKEKYIHRDLSNMQITVNEFFIYGKAARNCLVGDNNLVKVGDFGLTRYVVDDEYTASEGTKFPVKWAAPEVLDFTKFSSKSDVWAFGILCWEIFSGGRTPYPTFSNHQVVEEILHGYRLEQTQYCPRELYELMRLCWDATPEKRPSFRSIYESLQILTEEYG